MKRTGRSSGIMSAIFPALLGISALSSAFVSGGCSQAAVETKAPPAPEAPAPVAAPPAPEASIPQAPPPAPGTVGLPQDHEYQVVLRNYIATLGEADFALKLDPLSFDEAWTPDDESLHRLWIMTRCLPDFEGLAAPAQNYLLNNIESPDGVRLSTTKWNQPQTLAAHPEDTLCWSEWDYPGNPYRNSVAVRNRAFVVAAVDLMMHDKLHESGKDWVANGRRSDFLGGTLAWVAHAYSGVRQDLPASVRAAFETGMAKFVQRLNEWGPTAVNDNMDLKSLVGLAYLVETLREGPVVDQARAYVTKVLGRMHPCGMIYDAGGLEASYNGIALYDLAWANSVTKSPELAEALRLNSDLKAFLNLPEPDGKNFFGPSHFSTRTSADSANDQWAAAHRDIAAAMRADEALYLMFGGRSGNEPDWALPDRSRMLAEAKKNIENFNKYSLKAAEGKFGIWRENHWGSGRLNYAYLNYQPGFYGRLCELRRKNDPLTLPPAVRPGAEYVRIFPDPGAKDVPEEQKGAFMVARFPGYAAILYAGPIGWHSYMNFGGGALSAFWTPEGGSILLGRTGQPTHPEKTHQTWSGWRLWPTHALSGATPSGEAFSSARIRRRVSEVKYETGSGRATLSISGPIGKQHDDSRAAEKGCITGQVRFARNFALSPKGVEVETRLESDGTDKVAELCEILPLLVKNANDKSPEENRKEDAEIGHRVRFETAAGIIDPPEGFADGVTAVHIERFGGGAVIRFEKPWRMKLGEVWTDNYQTRMQVRNLIVDLLGKHDGPVPLPNISVRYCISPEARQKSGEK